MSDEYKTIRIAGDLSIGQWNDLNESLKPDNSENWDKAFDFFEQRIQTRYFAPIEAIDSLNKNKGEGIAMVTLLCSLIETIECFIKGWVYSYNTSFDELFTGAVYLIRDTDSIASHLVYSGISGKRFEKVSNKFIFQSFFENRKPFKSLEINGADFYENVRCALLHETQTKNNWKIKKGDTGNAIFGNDGKTINRDMFYQAVKKVIEDYKAMLLLEDKKAVKLRRNFIAKMNHICDKSH